MNKEREPFTSDSIAEMAVLRRALEVLAERRYAPSPREGEDLTPEQIARKALVNGAGAKVAAVLQAARDVVRAASEGSATEARSPLGRLADCIRDLDEGGRPRGVTIKVTRLEDSNLYLESPHGVGLELLAYSGLKVEQGINSRGNIEYRCSPDPNSRWKDWPAPSHDFDFYDKPLPDIGLSPGLTAHILRGDPLKHGAPKVQPRCRGESHSWLPHNGSSHHKCACCPATLRSGW